LKGNVGSGLFAMGDAFHNAGLIVSPVITLLLGIICVYSQHMLVSTSLFVFLMWGEIELLGTWVVNGT
jgi:amino acid permease